MAESLILPNGAGQGFRPFHPVCASQLLSREVEKAGGDREMTSVLHPLSRASGFQCATWLRGFVGGGWTSKTSLATEPAQMAQGPESWPLTVAHGAGGSE